MFRQLHVAVIESFLPTVGVSGESYNRDRVSGESYNRDRPPSTLQQASIFEEFVVSRCAAFFVVGLARFGDTDFENLQRYISVRA